MRNEMPQNQGELDAALLVEDKKQNLINNLASSWIYEKLVTNVRLSDKITDTKIEYSYLYSNLITTSPLGHNSCNRVDTYTILSSQSATGALLCSPIVVQQQRSCQQLQATAPDGQTERHPGISHTGSPRTCLGEARLWSDG